MSTNKKEIFFIAPTKELAQIAANKFVFLVGYKSSPLILKVKKINNEWVSQVNYFS